MLIASVLAFLLFFFDPAFDVSPKKVLSEVVDGPRIVYPSIDRTISVKIAVLGIFHLFGQTWSYLGSSGFRTISALLFLQE